MTPTSTYLVALKCGQMQPLNTADGRSPQSTWSAEHREYESIRKEEEKLQR